MKNTQLFEMFQSWLQQAQEKALEDEKPLDFESARKYLGVSKSTLYKATHLRLIPFTKPGGKKVYFKKSDLIKWMNSNPVKSVEEIEDAALTHIMNK